MFDAKREVFLGGWGGDLTSHFCHMGGKRKNPTPIPSGESVRRPIEAADAQLSKQSGVLVISSEPS